MTAELTVSERMELAELLRQTAEEAYTPAIGQALAQFFWRLPKAGSVVASLNADGDSGESGEDDLAAAGVGRVPKDSASGKSKQWSTAVEPERAGHWRIVRYEGWLGRRREMLFWHFLEAKEARVRHGVHFDLAGRAVGVYRYTPKLRSIPLLITTIDILVWEKAQVWPEAGRTAAASHAVDEGGAE